MASARAETPFPGLVVDAAVTPTQPEPGRGVNPGALQRTKVPTAAMLEVRSGVLSRYELPDDADVRRISGPALGESP